jgi:ABC-type glycerol-3-phosphate transport system substrate-binding protein
VSNVAFWINAATFRATGLDPARDFPRTWDQVIRLGQKLTIRKNGKMIQVRISLPPYNALRAMLVLNALIRQVSGLLFSPDGAKAYLTSPAALDVRHKRDHGLLVLPSNSYAVPRNTIIRFYLEGP